MKTMNYKVSTRITAALLVFVMVFASIVSAGVSVNGDLNDLLNALGFGTKGSSSADLGTTGASTLPYSYITPKGNYGYELERTSGIAVDGTKETAYTTAGFTLAAEYGLATGKETTDTFNVSFAADDANIYVLYEFKKTGGTIYYSTATGTQNYWYDCVDFVLDLTGSERQGTEFHIWGKTQGGAGTAIADTAKLAELGITEYYVKHVSGVGYNVEFAIPLSMANTAENGDKEISFTALSTITTAASGTSATRTYPTATNAVAGYADAAKPYPSTITVKAPNGGLVDNRYKYVLKEATTAITQDGVKDSAYNSGLHFKSDYTDGNAANKNSNNYFDLYLAADASYIYVLYEIADNSIVTDGAQYYHNDCADFCFNLTGGAYFNKEIRVWAEAEGTDHYDDKNADGTYKYTAHKSYEPAIRDLQNVESYTVKKTTKGYNVEMKISREEMNGGDTFSFLGVATQASSSSSRCYTYTANSFEKAGNEAKHFLNLVQIVPSTGKTELPEDEKPVDTYDEVIDYGKRWKHYLTESKSSLVLDGYRDDTYKNGLKFANTYLFNGPAAEHWEIDPNNTYELFMAADRDFIFVLYEFKDTNLITTSATSYYNDGVQFCFDKEGAASGDQFDIFYTTGERFGTVDADGLTATYIVRNNPGVGYNVEIMIPRSGITNGDLFSFTGLSTIATSLDDRSYGYIDNPLATGASNKPKSVLTQVEIIRGFEPVETEYDELLDDGARWKYYLEESNSSILLDGDRDVSYNNGLKFSNKFNRNADLDARNSFDVYVAADDDEVGIFYEITDTMIVANASTIYHNDCAQISFSKTGATASTTDGIYFPFKGGERIGTATVDGVTVTYAVKRSDDGYNVEVIIPRSEIKDEKIFSFIGIATLASSATSRTYGFMNNPKQTAANDTPRGVLTQIEIVDVHPGIPREDISDMEIPTEPVEGNLGVSNVSGGTADSYAYVAYKNSGFTGVDANKEAAYDNAVHLFGTVDNNGAASNGAYYDAYVAYGSDGLIHVYCEIKDDDIVTNNHLWNAVDYRTDGMDIYVWYGTTSTTAIYGITPADTSYSAYNRFGANKIAPVNVKKRLTDDGWAFEATLKYNKTASNADGAVLAGGEKIGIGFYYNDAWNYKYPDDWNAGGYNKSTTTQWYKGNANSYLGPTYAKLNTITFSNSDASTAVNTGAYDGIVNYPGKTVVVYPKHASTETKEDAMTLASTIGATAYEEGNAAIANATYVILAGHVTSHSETAMMINEIGYGKYGVGVFGNTISIIGPTEEMMDKAIETFLKVRAGTLPRRTLYTGTSSAVGGHSLPWLEATTVVTDSGYGNFQLIKWSANQAQYNNYCDDMLRAGYKIYATNELGGKYQSTTFYNATDIVTVNFGQHYTTDIIVGTAYTAFPSMGNSIRVLVSSRAAYALPEKNVPEYTPTHETVFVQMGESWVEDTDLCDIIRLDNGEFIIFDSEHTNDINYIVDEILALSGGEKPVIAAWFMTHFHQDHIGGFVELTKNPRIAEGMTIKNVVFNFGSRQVRDTASAGDDKNLTTWLQGLEYTGANLVYGYTGQTFRFANATVEILNTFSDSMPYTMTDTQDCTNPTNQLFSVRLDAEGTTQRFIITGDSSVEQFHIAHVRYGAYLKADFVQLPHHGWGDYSNYSGSTGTIGYNSNLAFYNYIDPTFVLIPRSKAYYCNPAEDAIAKAAAAKTGGEVIQNYDATNLIPKTIRLSIPYTKGNIYTYDDLVGGVKTPDLSNTVTGTANQNNGIGVNPNNTVSKPSGVTENGNYIYVTPTAYTNITTDGVMDNVYTYGVHLKGNKANNASPDVSYDVYLIAGQDGKIHVFYNVKDSVRVNKKTSEIAYAYRQDGIDFWYDSQFRGNGTVNTDVRIIAVNSKGAAGVATQKQYYVDSKIETGIFQDYAVVTNSTGYTVEFTIDKQVTNGDTFTFAALVNSISAWTNDSTYTNYTMTPDTYATRMAGKYIAPNTAAAVDHHNILLISGAPAGSVDETKTSGADDNANAYLSTYELASHTFGIMNGNDAGAQKVTGINTVYTVPTTDGEKDDIYSFGYHVEGKHTDATAAWMEANPHSFDAYIVYAEDGKFHVFIETRDTTPGCIDAAGYWRRDSVDFYYATVYSTDMNDSYHFDATEGTQTAGTRPADFKVVQTDVGFNYEFSFDRNGEAFIPGDILEFGVYMNVANDQYYTQTDGTLNTQKYNLASGSVAKDARAAYIAPSTNYYDGVQIMSLNSEVALAIAACDHNFISAGHCSICGVDCDHNYDSVVTAPTCTAEGYTTHTCSVCGNVYVDGNTEMLPHDYDTNGDCLDCDAVCEHEYGDDHICDVCGDNEVVETGASSGALYQIGLLEPWFIRINVRFNDANNAAINPASFLDYGAIAVRRSQLSDTTVDISTLDIYDLISDPNAVRFTGEDLTVYSDRFSFDYNNGLYTYILEDDIIWVGYYKDAEGYHYTAVRERSLYDLIVQRKDSTSSSYSEYEKSVYRTMYSLYNDVTDYRSDFETIPELEAQNTATMVTTDIEFANASGTTYTFKRMQQIGLIEPWFLRINMMCNEKALSEFDDYGIIVYYDKTGAATQMASYSDLLNYNDAENVYVFSDSQGTMVEGDGLSYADYNKDIFTYEMNCKMYYVFFVKDGEDFYYSNMYTSNIYDLAGTRAVSSSTSYSAKEKAVYADLVTLYDTVKAYRDDYFARNPE